MLNNGQLGASLDHADAIGATGKSSGVVDVQFPQEMPAAGHTHIMGSRSDFITHPLARVSDTIG
jgi:hypothetical protein